MGPTDRITSADRLRFETMRDIGCIILVVYFGIHGTAGQVHHLLDGGERISHRHTIYLTTWHHTGQPQIGTKWKTVEYCRYRFGPSLALEKRAFEKEFGTERDLLEMQNALLAQRYEINEKMAVG